ncbi:hypothetical protein BS47DRAFT_570625 [Hydnum rufescens UP504]|uniref:Uncharacterized protein n=1 Tax=Hydnum rufescens UP504 TaxID=1448309 RepID=A0A9P6B4E2_9AGAM|nr:hypothetical protein BS47DRAFT_570625 [Hydnum rufescens UP504]
MPGSFPPPPPPPSGPGGIPDDGKPTSMPVPGHPLLNNGRVLIYPPNYMCSKCHNIGYKNFDPTHPCRTCWERYSRPYAGALQYATWSPGSPNFQRPLPSFRPPSQTFPPPVAPRPHSVFSPPTQVAFTPGGPPPGALVVQPGDPRIGGRLCWSCNGRGLVPVMLFFDEERCPTCNGMGRVFP